MWTSQYSPNLKEVHVCIQPTHAYSQPRPTPHSTTPLNSPPRHVAAMARVPPPGLLASQHQYNGPHPVHHIPHGAMADGARPPASNRVPSMPIQEVPNSELRMTASGSGSGSGSGKGPAPNLQRSEARRLTPSRPIAPARSNPPPSATGISPGDNTPLRYIPLRDNEASATPSSSSRPQAPPTLQSSTTTRHKAPLTPLPTASSSRPATMDPEGDSIMRDAAEGLVQEQRRSLRGRAARSGAALDGAVGREGVGGGSEMSVIAGVSASGKGVKIGGAVKIGTGPGGVQRKKKKGDIDVVSRLVFDEIYRAYI